MKKLELSSEYFGRYVKKNVESAQPMAELKKLKNVLLKTKDGLLKTEDVLLKTKDGLLKTEYNRKQDVNICLQYTQKQEQEQEEQLQKSDRYSTAVLISCAKSKGDFVRV